MRMEYDCEIDCAPGELWPYLEDPEKQKLWMTGLLENEMIEEKPGHVGSTFRMRIMEGRKPSEYRGEITAYELDRHLGIKLSGGCMGDDAEMWCDYRLVDRGDRTLVRYSCHGDLKGFWKILAPLFSILGRMHVKKLFRNLQTAVHARAATDAEPAVS